MAAKKPTKKATSTGSPTLDAANAAKKFKAPKNYKPLTTAQKLAMAASIVGPGKVVKGAKAIKDEYIMAKAGWSAAGKASHRASRKADDFVGRARPIDLKTELKKGLKQKTKADARALKAANKPTRASKNPDTAAVKRIAEANRGLGQKEPYATRNAQERVDILNAHFGKAKGYKGNSTSPKKAIIKKKSK